jgi:hypothetical protein
MHRPQLQQQTSSTQEQAATCAAGALRCVCGARRSSLIMQLDRIHPCVALFIQAAP